MDTNTSEQPTQTNEKMTTKKQRNQWVKWVLIILALLLLLGAAVYFWWQWQECMKRERALENDKKDLQSQVEKLKKDLAVKPAETPKATCVDSPSDFYKENIKAALDSKNTAVFATYTTNPVKVVFAASEKGGNETPDQAAQSMEYTHSATGPWDFNLPAATIAHYDAGFYTDYFDANTYVGRAASGMVAAFDFDCTTGKVSQIFVAADDDLL